MCSLNFAEHVSSVSVRGKIHGASAPLCVTSHLQLWSLQLTQEDSRRGLSLKLKR